MCVKYGRKTSTILIFACERNKNSDEIGQMVDHINTLAKHKIFYTHGHARKGLIVNQAHEIYCKNVLKFALNEERAERCMPVIVTGESIFTLKASRCCLLLVIAALAYKVYLKNKASN